MSFITGADFLSQLTANAEHSVKRTPAQLRRDRAIPHLQDTLENLKHSKQKLAESKASDSVLLSELAEDYLAAIPKDCTNKWTSWCNLARKWPETLSKKERDDKNVQAQKKLDCDMRLLADIWGPRAALLLGKFQKYGTFYSHPLMRLKVLVAVVGSSACEAAGNYEEAVDDTRHTSPEARTLDLGSNFTNKAYALSEHDNPCPAKRKREDESLTPPHSDSFQNAYNAPLHYEPPIVIADNVFSIAFVSLQPIKDPPSVQETYHWLTSNAVRFLTGICDRFTQPTSRDESHDMYCIFDDLVLASHIPYRPLTDAIQQSRRQRQQTSALLGAPSADDYKIHSITVQLPRRRLQEKSVVLVTIK